MTRNILTYGGIAMFFCFTFAGNIVPTRQSTLPALDFLNDRITSWVDSDYFDAINVKVVKGNTSFFEYKSGCQDTTKITSSATGKWFAAATIAVLVDEGKMSWQDKVKKYLPKISDEKGEITLRQLLSTEEVDADDSNGIYAFYKNLKEEVEKIIQRLMDNPEKKSIEQNSKIVLAERMTEIATEKEWKIIFQKKIAKPLALKNTEFSSNGEFSTCAKDYLKFLNMFSHDGIYNGKRVMSENAILTIESNQGNPLSKSSEYVMNARQMKSNKAYGLGIFLEEIDKNGKPTLIGCPDKDGTYSWIDRKNQVYGLILGKANPKVVKDGFSPILLGSVLPLIVRDALAEEKYPKELKSGKVNIGNAQLYYEELGKGEPLILIHGHTLPHQMWDKQFFEYAKYFRVIRYDLRSYGYSSPQDGKTKFAHVDDLILFMDKMGIKQAHIVGLSLGGMIGADMLGLYPERIKSAVLASGNLRFKRRISVPMTSEESARRDNEIQALKNKGVDVMKREWFNDLIKSGGSKQEVMREPLWSMIYQWDAWHPLHKEVRSIYGEDAFDKLKINKPTVPVLILEGRSPNNKYDLKPLILNYLPKGKQVVIPDCGHMLNMERPAEFNKVVLDFIRSANK